MIATAAYGTEPAYALQYDLLIFRYTCKSAMDFEI